MPRKVALRFSEDLVHVGPLKYLARINAALVIEDMAAIPLHSVSYSSYGVNVASNFQRDRCFGILQMGEADAAASGRS